MGIIELFLHSKVQFFCFLFVQISSNLMKLVLFMGFDNYYTSVQLNWGFKILHPTNLIEQK